VYFPVPIFVSKYWSYPEVQKAKEELIYKNNRESPEEKLADFFNGMNGILLVMRRQERLKLLLTPFVHSIFGGKSLGKRFFTRFIPPQRILFLLITFFFNIYYSYESYYGYGIPESQPSIPENGALDTVESTDNVRDIMFPDFVNYFWYWKHRNLAILVIAATHFALGCSLSLRGILNSRAAENLSDIIPGRNYFEEGTKAQLIISKIITIIQFPRVVLVLASDIALPLLLVSCSGAALFAGKIWFYAPCLVDLLAQIRYMSFIVTALRRNVTSISLTVLLVVLFLYWFAVLAHLFFPNQYDLSGHMNCDDIGKKLL
jgi:hypothetical protein